MYIVIVRDIKADAYGIPMFVASIGGAVRSFGDEIAKNDGNPFALHPEDYELYDLGTWEPETNKWNFHTEKRQVALGSNFKTTR